MKPRRAIGISLGVLLVATLIGLFGHEPSYTREFAGDEATYTPRRFLSRERIALARFDAAQDIEIVSLQPPWEGPRGAGGDAAERAACTPATCIENHRILGRVKAVDVDRAALATTLSGWLHDEPSYLAACEPAFRHAITWRNGSARRTVLLCYSCGIYRVQVDGGIAGFSLPYGQGGWIDGDAMLNARLRAAGIRYFDNDIDQWVDPHATGAGGAAAVRTGT